MLSAKIIGTGSYIPDFTVTNDDFRQFVETDDEWIVSRTGIHTRHFSTGISNWEMGVQAAQKAIEAAGIEPGDIDLIIGTTITPDYYYPGLSNIVQMKLGCLNAACFDLADACTGFAAAVDVVWQFLRNGTYKHAMIVSSEELSKTLDFTDRSTCVLFGDGAGAAVFEACEESGILSAFLRSEPDEKRTLASRALAPQNPFTHFTDTLYEGLGEGPHVLMKGRDVFKFAARVMPFAIDRVLEGAGLTLSDIKYVIPHQANLRIIQHVAAHYGIEEEKLLITINRYGNISSACMPVTLDEAVRDGRIQKGDKLLFVGFGAGLSYGAFLMEW